MCRCLRHACHMCLESILPPYLMQWTQFQFCFCFVLFFVDRENKLTYNNISRLSNITKIENINTLQWYGYFSHQGCKFSGNCLNSGFHEVQISALLFIFSHFGRLLAQIHTLFQAFSFRSAYIPESFIVIFMQNYVLHIWKKRKNISEEKNVKLYPNPKSCLSKSPSQTSCDIKNITWPLNAGVNCRW